MSCSLISSATTTLRRLKPSTHRMLEVSDLPSTLIRQCFWSVSHVLWAPITNPLQVYTAPRTGRGWHRSIFREGSSPKALIVPAKLPLLITVRLITHSACSNLAGAQTTSTGKGFNYAVSSLTAGKPNEYDQATFIHTGSTFYVYNFYSMLKRLQARLNRFPTLLWTA